MKKQSFVIRMLAVAAFYSLSVAQSHSFAQAACGNQNPLGTSGSCTSCPCPTSASPNSINAYTGNEFREVKDLEVWGGVGEHQLAWIRYGNSRANNRANWFGTALNWRHAYQWDVAVSSNGSGPYSVNISYPDGAIGTFTLSGTAGAFFSTPSVRDILYYNSSLNRFTLQRAGGWQYMITQLPTTHAWEVTSFLDSQQNVYTLTYDNAGRLVQVTEPAGRYLKITYTTVNTNAVNYVTLATLGGTPPPSNQWSSINSASSSPVRYLRYQGADNTYSQVAELQYFVSGSSTPLTGTPFGSGITPVVGHEAGKAFDGGTSTWFTSSIPSGDYVGIDLGSPVAISKISYFPVSGSASAMAYGQFFGSIQKPTTAQVISRVDTSDGRSVLYTYGAINDPALPENWIVLNAAQYGDSTSATYTYNQVFPATRPVLTQAIDPRVTGKATNLTWQYYASSSAVLGFVQQEINGVTGESMLTVTSSNDVTPVVAYANGGIKGIVMNHATGLSGTTTDTLNRVTVYAYDQGGYGFLSSIKDPRGNTTQYTNSPFGNPVAIIHPDNSTQSWVRDNLDLPLSHTDELGHTTTYTRDANHRVTQISYPDGTSEIFTYNSYGEVTAHTLRNGGTETNVYDAAGLKTKYTGPLGGVTTYTYDSNSRVATETDPLGYVTSYQYNERGLVTRLTYPDSSFIAYRYDSFGDRTGITNELGKTWAFQYDEFKRIEAKTDPLGRTIAYGYDLPGSGGGSVCGCVHAEDKPTSITLPSGRVTTMAYDSEWQKLNQTVGAGSPDAATSSFTYDGDGNVTAMTDPRGKVWTYTYDSRNRELSDSDPLGNTTQRTFDAVGNKLTEKRADNGVTSYVFDSMNRLTSMVDPKSETTTFAYDNADDLISMTDARNNTYGFTYDLLMRKVSMTYPDSSSEQWSFDADGDNATYTTRAAQVQSFSYDNRNRQTGFTWSDGTPGAVESYDLVGRLLTLNSSVSSLSYTYDDANELLSETSQVSGGGVPKVVSYTYDDDGDRESITYPDGTMLGYNYTGRNQVANITTGGVSPMASYTYDANGNVIQKSLANGTVTNATFDNANRVLTIANQLSGTTLAAFAYTYNAVNDKLSRTESSGTAAPSTDGYTYDAIDQVTGVAYGSGRNVSYSYDQVGNRQSVTDTGVSTTYNTNNLNQYTSVNSVNPTYDANGNLTSNGAWTFGYDAQNRLVSVSGGPNNVSAGFAYDARNRCVNRTINGASTFYTYDGWSLLEERAANDSELTHYIQGANIDEIIAMVTGTGASFYHEDANGNTVRLTDQNGNLQESYTYDAYGAVSIMDGSGNVLSSSAVGNRFLFTGREWLGSVGLYDYRNRVYSQDLGRFLQTDPIRFNHHSDEERGGIDLYSYVINDPINRVDSYGLESNGEIYGTYFGGVSLEAGATVRISDEAGTVTGVGFTLIHGELALAEGLEALKEHLDQINQALNYANNPDNPNPGPNPPGPNPPGPNPPAPAPDPNPLDPNYPTPGAPPHCPCGYYLVTRTNGFENHARGRIYPKGAPRGGKYYCTDDHGNYASPISAGS